MKITKNTNIDSFFKCIKYPDLRPIQYKFCIARQITKLATGSFQYPECIGCHTGKQIATHFEGYQLPIKKGAKPNWNTDVIMNANSKKAKATTVKAQIEMVIDLLIDNKIDNALIKLGLILEEL